MLQVLAVGIAVLICNKEKESNSNYKGQQNYSFVTDNRKQREKRKTYAEALKEVFGNKVKETREMVVSDKERMQE